MARRVGQHNMRMRITLLVFGVLLLSGWTAYTQQLRQTEQVTINAIQPKTTKYGVRVETDKGTFLVGDSTTRGTKDGIGDFRPGQNYTCTTYGLSFNKVGLYKRLINCE